MIVQIQAIAINVPPQPVNGSAYKNISKIEVKYDKKCQ
jgi:hypothetical protein